MPKPVVSPMLQACAVIACAAVILIVAIWLAWGWKAGLVAWLIACLIPVALGGLFHQRGRKDGICR